MRRNITQGVSLVTAIGLAGAITVYSGVIHGRMSNRWGSPPRTAEAVEQLAAFPEEFGHWEMVRENPSTDDVQNMLQLFGELSRTYQNRITGEWVSLNVFIGPPGPIAAHTPEICMGSQHWRQIGQSKQVEINAAKGSGGEVPSQAFWLTEFEERRATGQRVRVYYGWSTGGPWSAPSPGLNAGAARVTFAGSPYLYKLQLLCLSPPVVFGQASPDAGERFLRDALPVLNEHLVPAVGQ